MEDNQFSYFKILPKELLSQEETLELARKKKAAAKEFVRAFLQQEPCQSHLLNAWRRRQRLKISVSPMAEEYGSSMVQSEDLAQRINHWLSLAVVEQDPGERIRCFQNANLSFENYVRIYENPIIPPATRAEITPFFETYLFYRNKLVEYNLKLVPGFVSEFLRKGIEFEDLLQHGNLGLIKAIDKFDPDRDTRISTYANWWIRRYISDYIKDTHRTIRVPRHVPALVQRVTQFQQEFIKEHDRRATPEEVAVEFPDLPVIKQLALEHSCSEIISLSAITRDRLRESERDGLRHPHYISGTSIEDQLFDDQQERRVVQNAEASILQRLLTRCLTEMEKQVITRRYGLHGVPLTFARVAADLGLNLVQVKEIERRALRKLREGTKGE